MTNKNSRVIAVTSGKGGVGKTTLAVNLGISLSRLGLGVCLFDADTHLANINIMLRESPAYTLQQVLDGSKKITDTIVHAHGVSLVPGASGLAQLDTLGVEAQQRLAKAFAQLEQMYDLILVDTSAGIQESVLRFIESAQQGIVVITPEPTSLTDAFTLLRMLRKRNYRQRINVVVNRAESEQNGMRVFERFSAAVAKYLGYKVSYLGVVENDELVSSAICSQVPVRVFQPSAKASRCYDLIAENVEALLQKVDEKQLLNAFSEGESNNTHPPELIQSESIPIDEGAQWKEYDDEELEQLYREEDKKRKKQVLEEHKLALLECIEDAELSETEVVAILEQLNAAYIKKHKSQPAGILEYLNHLLPENAGNNPVVGQLLHGLNQSGKFNDEALNQDISADSINKLINDYVNEYGQYPFDATQSLMQSIGMGQVTDEAIRELDNILRLVSRSGQSISRRRDLIVADIEDDPDQDIKPTEAVPTSKRRDLLDSINFASRLIDK